MREQVEVDDSCIDSYKKSIIQTILDREADRNRATTELEQEESKVAQIQPDRDTEDIETMVGREIMESERRTRTSARVAAAAAK